MNNWMDDFIARCLADVPPGRYRRRTEKELRDHMETLRQFRSEAEALRAMGDPKRLRREYFAAWSRTVPGRANLFISGFLSIYALTFLTYALLLVVRIDQPLVTAAALYLIPFPLGAALLRYLLRDDPHRTLWLTLGLLAAWAGENLYLVSTLALPASAPGSRTAWGDLLPFLPYLLLTFAGCLVLGWLFGRSTERKRELA